MNAPLRRVIDALEAEGFGPRQSGDQWSARCPAHEDSNPSLSIGEGDDGRVLLRCHADCSVNAIAEAVGLEIRDLFPTEPNGTGSRIVAAYPYRDKSGQLLYEVVRTEPKGFFQRRPDENGGWVNGTDGVRRVLYRLPEMIQALGERPDDERVVFVVEGEKDADRLRAEGLIATTNVGGAGKWKLEYTKQLLAAGARRVAAIPDNDKPGVHHVEVVARSCAGAGLETRIVRLPGLPPVRDKHGEDVSDWLDQGHTREELLDLAEAAPAFIDKLKPDGNSLLLIPLSEFLEEPADERSWVVDQMLPAGGFSLFAGKPKAGKSTTARTLALSVARGEPWLGRATQQGTVFYLAFEEKRDEVRSHFRRMGATGDDTVSVFIARMPEDGFAQLEHAVRDQRPTLIIVDTLIKLLPMENINDYSEVSRVVERLLLLARETGAHVMAVHHAGKADRPGGDSILGSTALFGTADTALILMRGERYRSTYSQQRYGEDLPETVVTLDPETGRVETAGTREDADITRVGDEILETLRGKEEAVAETEAYEGIEARKKIKEKALRLLVADGRVTRTGKGRKGDPYIYSICSRAPEGSNSDEGSSPSENDSVEERSTDSGEGESATPGSDGADGGEDAGFAILPPPNSGEGEKRIHSAAVSSSDGGGNAPSRKNNLGSARFDPLDGESTEGNASPVAGQQFGILPPTLMGEGENEKPEATESHAGNGTYAPSREIGILGSFEVCQEGESLALPFSDPIPTACPIRAHARFWKDHFGGVKCVDCHPPAPEAVSEWIGPQ